MMAQTLHYMLEDRDASGISGLGETRPVSTGSALDLALQAFHSEAKHQILKTNCYRMKFFHWGSGPPLVFIHGMADRARAFVMVMHRLVQHRTCIAYELPDGKTDGSDLRRYTHADYVADLVQLLDHLAFSSAAVLGSSFGSTIALSALANSPRRFTHGILQGGFAFRPLSFAQRLLCRSAQYWPGWFADWPELYRQILWKTVHPTFTQIDETVRDFLLENGGHTPIQAAAIRSLMIDRTDLRPVLSSIQTPVLLLGGDRDPLVPRWCEELIVKDVPFCRRVEFSGCGHYPQYTHPFHMAEAISQFAS